MKRTDYFFSLSGLPRSFLVKKESNIYYEFLENKYVEFLQHKKNLKLEEFTQIYELHHIVPRYVNGNNSYENLIPLTPEDHALAHYYRYQVYQEFGDLAAWNLRKNSGLSSPVTQQAKFQEIRQTQQLHWKTQGIYFYDSQWQKKQAAKSVLARKGKYFGGADWYTTEKAKQAQQKGGLAQQSPDVKIFLSKWSEWRHLPSNSTIVIRPAGSLGEIHKVLNQLKPNPKFQSKHMSLLTRGQRPTLHGWKIIRVFLDPPNFDC